MEMHGGARRDHRRGGHAAIPSSNLITRASGTGTPTSPATAISAPWKPGDYLLLCTDGLVNTVTDQEMLFEVVHGGDPDTCLRPAAAYSAKRQGAPDNVTGRA